MFELKDASKSDERQVKNTLHSKPLTRKRKGETHTMGNRGIQLSVFFVISLMLIAGLFSNAAMAAKNDAKGEVAVEWVDGGTAATALPTFAATGGTPVTADATPTGTDNSHLNAASRWNLLQFTYTAWNDADGDGTFDTGDDTAINMAGGRVRITFPGGWSISAKSVRVEESYLDDDDNLMYRVLYETNAAGDVLDGGGGRTTVGTSASRARVSFTANKNITVSLDNGWVSARDDVTKELVITLADVQAGIPRRLDQAGEAADVAGTLNTYVDNHAAVTFEASSSARNGTLIRLAAGSPTVRVGSIVGDGKGDNLRDTLERKLVITPKRVFSEEQNHAYNMIFEAPGPMYGKSMVITVPSALAPAADLSATGVNVTVNQRGGADLGTSVVGATGITIPIQKIDVGQEIVVSYRFRGDQSIGLLSATVADRVQISATATDEGGAAQALVIDGGHGFAEAGSGKVTIQPSAMEMGSLRRNLTVTYTAYTDLENPTTISIQTNGLIIDLNADPVEKLQKDDPAGYGYVFGDFIDELEINAAGDMITWTVMGLKAGRSLKATINQVNISKVPDEYPWMVMVSGTTAVDTETTAALLDDPYADADGDSKADDNDEIETAYFTVVRTSKDTVTFEVDKTDLRALNEETLEFKFTAATTAIRDGYVSFRIPAALGTAPTTADAAGEVAVSISGGRLQNNYKDTLISGRTITVQIKRLDVSGFVTVLYGHDKKALLHYEAGTVKIPGTFRTSSSSSVRTAGEVEITLGNVPDGKGDATLRPLTIEAGSGTGAITVEYTAEGTMDGGQVSLEIPSGWGAMQNDPTLPNYIKVNPVTPGVVVTSTEPEPGDSGRSRVIAQIEKLAKGQKFQFIYGGGTGGESGVEVQDTVGIAEFTIKSDGDGDNVFDFVTGTANQTAKNQERNSDKLGQVFKDGTKGALKIKVTSARDGTGTVSLPSTQQEVRAADAVQLTFTYSPTQTIVDGQLKLTVPGSWSPPQVSEIGVAGYTEVEGLGVGTVEDEGHSIIVDIFSLDPGSTIKINYGASASGRAIASATAGESSFRVAVKGHANGVLSPLRRQPSVTIIGQGSGKGHAVVDTTDERGMLHAGDSGRELTVTYTAVGQLISGKVRLTVPTNWSGAAGNVTVMVGTEERELTFEDQMAEVEDVSLDPNGKVTFVYTGDVQPEPGSPSFVVAVHGGLSTDSYADVSGDKTMLSVDVVEARAGSGTGTVSRKVVQAGEMIDELKFTYTAVGTMSSPREVWVYVPPNWPAPTNAESSPDNMGTYTVDHIYDGVPVGDSAEEINPYSRRMRARIRLGGFEIEAGNQIEFTFQNVTAPENPEISPFRMGTDASSPLEVDDAVYVRVQDSMPSMLSLSSAATVSADEGAMPLGITVGLQDADGTAVAMENDIAVTLTSTSTTGAFSMESGEMGTESITVTIDGGDVAADVVYYTDSTAGTTTITASAPGQTMASQDITVTAAAVAPDAVVIDSVTVAPTLAMAGETVTVSAMGSAGQMAMFSVTGIVTNRSMTEEETGSYSGSFMVVADQHADGMYDVTVNLGTASDMASLTLDSTMPTVTVTAPESAANGDEVMISAMVTDASAIPSVSVDVSMLDSTQTDPVALAMGDDGAYSATITISDANENANGEKTITVTAMDAAGNSGSGEAMVMLKNTLSYTSVIPAGLSLFHVPLDVEGLDTVGDLKGMIGNGSNLAIVYDHATGSWNSRSDDVAITADLGIVLSMASAATYTFEGEAWGGGTSMISLQAGPNLIGLPVNDPRVTNVSDISSLFDEGVVSAITVSTADGFELASDTTDPAVMGDAAYLVTASAAGSAILLGDGWSYEMASSAPIALAGYKVDGQTAVLDINGAVVDEITGLAKEGFRVKVKNLSTKASLSKVTSVETAEGYNMTFVDLKAGNAARIGDVLEISADSPSPLIGVQPVRHIVTADDVKSGILALEDLIAYEIPAETELLRNYPNPFNPETWIPYRLAEDADVSLTIYDVNGTMVRTIDIGHQSAAVYESRSKAIYWDGRNRFGEQVASGIYFYSLSAGDFSATRKMVILK